MSDDAFRQFEQSIEGGPSTANNMDGVTTGHRNRFGADADTVGQVAYWQQRAPQQNQTGGFSAMEQPRVESFPPATVEAEVDRLPPPTAEAAGGGPIEADVEPSRPTPPLSTVEALPVSSVEPAPAPAATISVGPELPAQMMGPALPEESNFEVPISEQEIGQLHEQILVQQEAAKNETGEEKERHLLLLENARKSLSQANKLMWKDIKQQSKAQNFEREKERLVAELEEIRPQQQPSDSVTADQLFEELERLRADLAARNVRLREINKSELQQKKRMEKIPELRTKAKADLADNRSQMKDQENGEGNAYAMVLLRARELELQYSIKALGSESKLHELENRLLPIRGDDLTREIKLLEAEIDAWNFAANEQRRKDIAEEVRLAREAAIKAAPALKTLADTNARLTELRAEFAGKIRLASEEDVEVQSELNVVKNHHENAEKEIAGNTFNQANGIRLVEIRRQLPTPFRSQARIGEIESDLRQISLAQLELNEERRMLAHPVEYVEQKLAGVTAESLPPERLRELGLEFVENIRTQYDQLSSDHHDYVDLLRRIVSERKELVGEINSTVEFVDEQTLWIQSAKSIGLDHLAKTRSGAREFFDPAQWYSLLDCLTTRMFRRPHESAVGLAGLVGLFVFSRRFRG